MDGSYGEPQPNKAMSLLGAVEGEIERLKRSPGPNSEAWQPIATAPKGGGNLLLTDGENVSEGGWLSDVDMGADYEGQFGGGAGWWSVHGSMKPTAWKPMPAAPNVSGATTNGEKE